ncbi:MAG: exodeoxyribonuclease V subunit alpha [Methylococcales bacterium]
MTDEVSEVKEDLFAQQLGGAIARISNYDGSTTLLEKSISLLLSELEKGNTFLDMNLFYSKSGQTSVVSWKKSLIDNGFAGIAPAFSPLIIEQDTLYLGRYYHYHHQLQQQLSHLANAEVDSMDETLISHSLNKFFPGEDKVISPNWQKIAASVVLKKRFSVISGGPGTGKTTTVLRLLATLCEVSGQNLQIQLAAPTGKAAMRMQESIRSNIPDLEKLGCSPTILKQLDVQACTIHRLLGYKQNSINFRHNTHYPLSLDVLVVDESSMIDSAMMAKLLAAVPDKARVILLGDKDQLAAVEPGNPFTQMCNQFGFSPDFANELFDLEQDNLSGIKVDEFISQKPKLLADNIVFLHHSYRFGSDSGIGQLAKVINHGDYKQALQLMKSPQYSDISWHEYQAADFRHYQAIVIDPLIERVKIGFSAYTQAVNNKMDLDAIFKAYNSFCILTAVRRGYSGVEDINYLVQNALKFKSSNESIWYHGRAVMVTQNNYQTGLFNGDVGICLAQEDNRLRVYFPTSEGYRDFIPSRVPHHETAFAITVHKSQGSEFEEVLFMLPDTNSRLLDKSLAYTAITRAKNKVEIWGNKEALDL